MARMRTIKPEFWVDDKVVDLSVLAKLLFIGLWNFADDDGYLEGSPRRVKRQVFPDNDYDVKAAIDELVSAGMLRWCTSDQGELLHIVHFKQHQKPQHPTPTKFTNITEKTRDYVTPHEGSGENMSAHPVVVVESSNREAPRVRVTETDFEKAYSHWPKKVERKEAFERFKVAAKKRGLDVLTADVIRFGDAYARTTDRQFVPALGVWLNKERWSDELPGSVVPISAPRRRQFGVDE